MSEEKGELKFYDYYWSNNSINRINGTQYLIPPPPHGSGMSEMVGDRIRVCRIQLSINVKAIISRIFDICRIILYIDRSLTGAIVTPLAPIAGVPGGLLEAPPSSANPLYVPWNMNEEDRYEILYDELVPVQCYRTSSAALLQKVFVETNHFVDFDMYVPEGTSRFGPMIVVGVVVNRNNFNPVTVDGVLRYRYYDV